MTKHKKFGRVCMCDCHKDGSQLHHFMPCCSLTYKKYINADGTLDEERLLALYEKYGIPLWTWWDRFKDWFGNLWLIRKWIAWRRRIPKFTRYEFPIIMKTYPNLKAEDIVRSQPMTAPVPMAIAGKIRCCDANQD